jgi:hypothetical protein
MIYDPGTYPKEFFELALDPISKREVAHCTHCKRNCNPDFQIYQKGFFGGRIN